MASDPLEEGKLAFSRGERPLDNPHKAGTEEAGLWEEGYYYAEQSNEDGDPADD